MGTEASRRARRGFAPHLTAVAALVFGAFSFWVPLPIADQKFEFGSRSKMGETYVLLPGTHIQNPRRSSEDALRNGPDSAARTQLELGQIYERLGKYEEAEAAYLKALDTGSQAIVQTALQSIERIARVRIESAPSRARSLILTALIASTSTFLQATATLVFTLLLAALLLRILRPVGWWRGKGKLEVASFADSTSEKLSHNFREILEVTLARMRLHYMRRGIVRAPPVSRVNLPVVVGGETPELAEIVASATNDPARIVGWALRHVNQPEYVIRGSLQHDGAGINIIMRLEKRGHALMIWDIVFAPQTLFDVQKELAYQALLLLKRQMNP